ncbi:serine-enriched protein [Gigaspora margarita]|uniref:Serine-enriched protein n=1 Tax=Gigaspora margarita TaxID=4874 RepID=A0A8H4EV09_GIGMA|nr:serine-enriched protein [Gigaspora margarita]
MESPFSINLIFLFQNNETSIVDITIASYELQLQLLEVYQKDEERLFENKLEIHLFNLLKCDDLELIEIEVWKYLIQWRIENTDSIEDYDLANLNSRPSFKILSLRGYPFESKIICWIDKRRMPYHFTNLPFKFMLIYRANRDGFEIENSYINCDNKGSTVIIKVCDSGEIIGGYNPLE